ncbi:MAG TPA: xylanase, partial [Thermoanaerobaculia bacterium]|nr:xylanase [Thermoanaerobaculia bacterium]
SYLWSNGATTQSIVVTATGNFDVTVTNASGCSSAKSPAVAVTVNPNPATPAISASGPTTFCQGGSVTLTAPASASYLWSNGATTQSIVVTATGNYSVVVRNAAGCSSAASAAQSVTVNPATAITAQPQSATIPKNTSTTLSVTATGTGTLSYQWYRGTSGNTSTPIANATGSTVNTGKLTRGTYTYWVRVTGACGVVNSNTATINAQ